MATVAVRLNADTGQFEKAFTSAARTVSGFERTFANTASSLEGHKRRIDAAFASLSGDSIIRDANAMVAAVQRIGGASRLTETEMRRVNATVQEAINKYTQLGQTAPREMLALAGATRQVTAATTQVADAARRMEPHVTLAGRAAGILGSAFGQFTAAGLAVSAINRLTGEVVRFVSEGAKLPGLEASFQRLTRGISQDSAAMLAVMQQSTRGLVSEMDLMQSANKAILLGLPVTTESMGELARTATVLGRAMGQGATKSFDDLITALGRSSPLILDNLGLTVKVDAANQAYARSLGIAASELTEVDRKMAFYNAAMDAARAKTRELGDQTLTLGEQFSRVWTSIGNSVTRGASNINVVLGNAISSFANFRRFLADAVAFTSFDEMRRQIDAANESATTTRPRGGRPRSMLQQANDEAAALAALRASAKSLNDQALKPLTDTQRELAIQFNKGGLNAQEIAEKLNSVKSTAGVSEAQINKLVGSFRGLEKSAKAFDALSDALSGAAVQKEANDLAKAFDRLNDVQKATPAVMLRVGEAARKLRDEGARLTTGLSSAAAASQDFADAQKSVMFELELFQRRIDDIGETFDREVSEGLKDVAADFETVATSIAASAEKFEEEYKQGLDEIKQEIKDTESVIAGFEAKLMFSDRVINSFGFVTGALDSLAAVFDNTFGRILNGAADVVQGISNIAAATTKLGVIGATIELGSQIGKQLQPLLGLNRGKLGSLLGTNNQGRNDVEDFVRATFGSFDELHRKLGELGPKGEQLWIQLTQLPKNSDTKAAAAAIKAVTDALDEFGTEAERAQKRLDSLAGAVGGVNQKAELFAAPFQKMIDGMKSARESGEGDADAIARSMMAAAQAGQAEFERLGVFVSATFASMVKETGDVFGAITALEPAFKVLQQGVNEFGLTSTGTIDSLLSMFGLVNDAVTGPILQSIQATSQIFTGLQDAGYLTADLFQTVASDIGASFRDLEAKGGDVAKAMALSQPILQKLWEGQQIYGNVTDETTRALLEQAEQQGLVGAHMKDVNQKILDVLIAIADVFRAKLPESFRATSKASSDMAKDLEIHQKEAARNIQREFDNIKLNIPVRYDDPGFTPRVKSAVSVDDDGQPRLVALARGGVVRRPTLALVGEAGPEAVIPLSQMGSMRGDTTLIVELDGHVITRRVVQLMPGEVHVRGYM